MYSSKRAASSGNNQSKRAIKIKEKEAKTADEIKLSFWRRFRSVIVLNMLRACAAVWAYMYHDY
jgi:hypothetical protein